MGEQPDLFGTTRQTHLKGKVSRVFFQGERWSALEVTLTIGGKVRVSGALPLVHPGDEISGMFESEEDPKWGLQYHPISVESKADTSDVAGLDYYLAQRVTGLGPSKAAKLIKRFGEKSTEALGNPKELAKVPGIGPNLAGLISASWNENKGEYLQLRKLFKLGLTYYQATLALDHFGAQAATIVENNVYHLTQVSGIGFKIADKIALAQGMEEDDARRLRAAAYYAVQESLSDGNTISEIPLVYEYMSKKAGVEGLLARAGLAAALQEGELTYSFGDTVALPGVVKVERKVIQQIKKLSGAAEKPLKLKCEDPELTEEQASIFEVLANNRLAKLTGGPGVGKTRTVAALVKAFNKERLNYALCAPTGKAARRIQELTGEEASTIHRLLVYEPKSGGFLYGEHTPLPYDLVVVDECSMVDVFLMHSLLKAIGPRTRLLLVGDADQLPPVGAGQPFSHIHNNSVKLTKIFRQAQENPIIMAAHAINEGKYPKIPEEDVRLTFRKHPETEDVKDNILRYYEHLKRKYGEAPQVITPMNIGPIGVEALNKLIKSSVNPGDEETGFKIAGGTIVHVGDTVIQTKNNYEIGVMNGEIGTVLDFGDKWFTIRTALGDVNMKPKDARTFQLGYAITIHKSQGSEWKSVIMICHTSHFVMLSRELVYTGLTRASEAAWIVGAPKALAMAVKRTMSERSTLMGVKGAWAD